MIEFRLQPFCRQVFATHQADRRLLSMKSDNRHFSPFGRGAGRFDVEISYPRTAGVVQSPMFPAWRTGAERMKVSLLRERLRLSKRFIVPGFAVLGETGYGRPSQKVSPIDQAILPPAALRGWSNAR